QAVFRPFPNLRLFSETSNMERRSFLDYVARRLGIYILTVLGSFTVAFLFFHLIPGDPIGALLTSLRQQYSYATPASQAMIDAYRVEFGLAKSLPEQYIRYLGNVVLHFDLGPSLISFPTHAQDLILRAMPWTIGLLGVSVVISWVLGVLVGGLLGWRRNLP